MYQLGGFIMRRVVRPPWLLLLIPLVASFVGCADNAIQAPAAPTAVLSSDSAASAGGLSSGTAAAKLSRPDVPFSGVVTGEAAFDFVNNPKGCAAGFTTITTAKGQGTHMGRTTWRSEHCLGEASEILNGALVLSAANGDDIYATYTGSCAHPPGDLVICSGDMMFTGGTGRFKNASGTAEFGGEIVFEGFNDPSWPGRWEWKGTIRY
jgi:hypothetical protein